jgi:hypothetical protein
LEHHRLLACAPLLITTDEVQRAVAHLPATHPPSFSRAPVVSLFETVHPVSVGFRTSSSSGSLDDAIRSQKILWRELQAESGRRRRVMSQLAWKHPGSRVPEPVTVIAASAMRSWLKKGSPQAGMNEHKSAKCVLQDTAYTASPWHDYSPCVLAPAIQVPKVREKRRVQHCHATFPLGLGRPSDPRLRGTGTTRSECCSDQSPCGRSPDARGQRCEGANEGGLLHCWRDQQPAFGSSFC